MGRQAPPDPAPTRATSNGHHPSHDESGAAEAARTARGQRGIQKDVAAAERRRGGEAPAEGAMQAGARPYPAPPFPPQHQAKPGRESALDPAPMYDAPYYKGSGKLEGKVAMITGADSGIGRAVAVFFAREGADVALLYLDEHDDARVTREAVEREGRRAAIAARRRTSCRVVSASTQSRRGRCGRRSTPATRRRRTSPSSVPACR